MYHVNNLKRYTLYFLNAIDIVSIFLSYFFSMFIRIHIINDFHGVRANYNYFLMVVLVAYFIVNFLFLYKDDKYLSRNALRELGASVKVAFSVIAIVIFYFNFAKLNSDFSRIFEVVFFVLFIGFDFVLRITFRNVLLSRKFFSINSETVLLVAPASEAEKYVSKINNSLDWRYRVTKVFITTEGFEDSKLGTIPVLQNREDVFTERVIDSIDGVIIVPGKEDNETIQGMINTFKSHGKIVHIQIPEYDLSNSFRILDNIGSMAVVTYKDLQPMSIRQQMFKRAVDIVVSLLILPFFLVVMLIVKVFTQLESPGPVIIRRVRVGKNSRRFFQLRFRIYRTDATEREKNGKSPYTFIGKILETTHIDGLPMIINVLSGEMSLVGPKAPNLPKYVEMSTKERNLLLIRPGIVGYWTAEKDPVKALADDTEYLEKWDVSRDIIILIFCIIRYLSFHSLRIHGDTHVTEEFAFADSILKSRIPVRYNRDLYTANSNPLYLFLKRTTDMILSLAGIVVLSPVFLIITILVISDDGGYPFYTQERVGKDGKRIRIYKFRSMRMDAGNLEELLTPEQLEHYKKEFKIDNDPRITSIGNFIRKTSLDELPQLLNILFGQLSIVGPRPILEPELFENYSEAEIAKLLSVRPGLTGYWQAYARNNATYESGERQRMEMHYIDNASVGMDIRIFFKTFSTVLNREGVS